MEKIAVTIGEGVQIRGAVITPVSRFSLHSWPSRHMQSGLGMKWAIAVIISAPSGSKVFLATGEEIQLKDLVKEYPELKQPLKKLQSF